MLKEISLMAKTKPNPFAQVATKQTSAEVNPKPIPIDAAPSKEPQKTVQASRENKRPMTAFLDEAAIREIKMLVADTRRTQQDLFKEAINDLLVKYGKRPLA
jgi:hypothetical protein